MKEKQDSKEPIPFPPDEAGDLKTSPSATGAGGPGAVFSSLKHLYREGGIIRSTSAMLKANQLDGFDCPGCAWPESVDHRGKIEFCENGAKAIAEEITTQRVDGAFFENKTLSSISLENDFWIGKRGRITEPLYKTKNAHTYVPITWELAFQKITNHLKTLEPEEMVFYTSGRTSNEAAFLYQLFVRSLGTNNLPDCSNMCHESSGVALKESIGIGKGTVRLEDFEKSQLIFVIGQNPGTNHPRMLIALQKAVRNGATIVAINPLREAGLSAFAHPQEPEGILGLQTPLAKIHLPVKINGDVALFLGLIKAVLELERNTPGKILDWPFIEKHTHGFSALQSQAEASDWGPIVKISGISKELIEETAAIYASSHRTIACWAMGLTQHVNAVANIQQVVNLMLLRGNVGKTGAGLCPVRGHSNVQGDRTMGIWERPPAEFLEAIDREFLISCPRKPGLNTVESIQAMLDGNVGFFCAMGGNFLQAGPDTEKTALGLKNVDLAVHVSTKLNRTHLVTGPESIILPCLSRTDLDGHGESRFLTVENSMGIVHPTRGNLEPCSKNLRSEVEIVSGLASSYFGDSHPIQWSELGENYDRIREHISRVIPGFHDFNHRLSKQGVLELPNPPRDSRDFLTTTGKANFFVHSPVHTDLKSGEYLLMTIRSHDQFNTTIYGLDDRYRGIFGDRRVVFMNIKDMQEIQILEKQLINLVCREDGEERRVRNFRVIAYEIPRGCIASYFPEANPLVPLSKIALKSHTPASKSIICTVEKP